MDSPKLIIIDDNRNLLFSLNELFKKSGYQVITAENGRDGLNLIRQNSPDLVICDVMMPPPNGFEVQNLLAENPLTQNIPFIFLTARTSKADVLNGLQHGADDYITKPFDPDILLARVESILRRMKLSRLMKEPPVPIDEKIEYENVLVKQIGIILEKTNPIKVLERAQEKIGYDLDDVVTEMARTLYLQDVETESHCLRLVELLKPMAMLVGITEPELTYMRYGAILHDIGKICIPEEILKKKTPLSDFEKQFIRKHPNYAFMLLSKYEFMLPALDIPLYHHEQWDGNGYPFGLKSYEIPLAVRVFSIVDMWDAITMDRSYRDAIPKEESINIMISESGKMFEPMLVQMFIDLHQEE
ncbi:MAG: HD domain-containing phosphohydrolase [Chloroflexota bacterium]